MEIKRGRLQRTVLETGTPNGTWYFLCTARVDSLLLCYQCFVQGDRHTERGVVGSHTSTTKQSTYIKDKSKLENLWLHDAAEEMVLPANAYKYHNKNASYTSWDK